VTLSWNGTSIIPAGVFVNSSLSYIMCPLLADAVGHPEWFPAEACPRPGRMGVAVNDAGVVVPDPSRGARWSDAVAMVVSRMEA